MSAGTDIIISAMKKISVYSPALPTESSNITDGMVSLNGMIDRWYGDRINMKVSPLKAPGGELSEPADAKIGIIANLALEIAPDYPNAKVSSELRRLANTTYQSILRKYYTVEIPKKKARDTYPKGEGNYYNFFTEGEEVGSSDA